MSLSDVIGHLDLAVWPKMALVLFVAVFVAVTVKALRGPQTELDRAAHLPIDEEEVRNG
jgi:hypothetical protein